MNEIAQPLNSHAPLFRRPQWTRPTNHQKSGIRFLLRYLCELYGVEDNIVNADFFEKKALPTLAGLTLLLLTYAVLLRHLLDVRP